jgi:Peptidase family C25
LLTGRNIAGTVLGMVWGILFGHAQLLTPDQFAKFAVTSDGIYKVDYSLLKKSGFDPDQIDPRRIKIFAGFNGMLPQSNAAPRQNQLKELAIFVQGESDGKFDKNDYVLFFGQGPDSHSLDVPRGVFKYENNIYSDRNFYFLTVDASTGSRLVTSPNLPGIFPSIDSYDDFGYYETDHYNILESGREWFGEQFDAKTEITVRFNTPGIVPNSPIKFVSRVMTQSYDAASSFKIYFNDVQILEQNVALSQNSQYSIKGSEAIDTIVINSTSVAAPSNVNQDIKYQYLKAPTGASIGYLNYFIFTCTRALALYGNQTVFSSAQSLSNPVSTFKAGDLPAGSLIWDVTDPFNVRAQEYLFAESQSSFSASSGVLKTFVVFLPDKSPAPSFESLIAKQNLSGPSTPDLLIVTHPNFKNEALRLAAFRQSHNKISVRTVTTEEIYNGYSGGKQDITAIRDFIKDLYNRPGDGLDNVLLFGRCSYDYKNRVPANTNFVPTYESKNSLSPLETYSSDDYFGFLEANEGDWNENPATNHTLDIGIGRISVTTSQEAADVVDKLIDYETNANRYGSWRKNILFVADDGDFNIHQDQANQLATTLDTNHPEFDITKIYLDQFKQINKPSGQFSPDTKDALERAIEKGVAIVNFTGHGSENVWMQEQVLDQSLVEQFKNAPQYPIFVTATCEFGRHDDPFQISSGEKLLLQPKGGAIGLVTTARPVYANTNFELNKAFYNALFVKTNGAYRDLGSIFRDTKNNSLSGVGNRNFSLLGDPSMQLPFSSDNVALKTAKTTFNSDTLKALSTASITGEIQRAGVLQSSFNGVVEVALYDRPVSFITRGDENPPFTYSLWSNALFRGEASVTAGNFQLTFVVPDDLAGTVATGKISFYAQSNAGDASGASSQKVGGRETSFPQDDTPPLINLFMGDTTFVSGGIASPNTALVVKLEDDHGISITGLGDSNNLIAILDDSMTFIINDYYKSAKNDYTRGVVRFPFWDLPQGSHSILVKVSDTYGNRTSTGIDFVITAGNLVISEFYNYPNPFSDADLKTTIGFMHNRPGEDLDVQLTIMDMMGQVVDTEQFSVLSSLTAVTLTEWNGTNGTGNKLRPGIYLGKLFVRSLLDGSKNQQFTKLIIVN